MHFQSALRSASADVALSVGAFCQAWSGKILPLAVLSPAKGRKYTPIVVESALAGRKRLTW